MPERTVFQSVPRKHVLSLGPRASVWEAACAMTRENCGSILVMEPPDRLLGIVTERDLMTRVLARALEPRRTSLAEVMTAHPICVAPESLVSDAVLIMIERGFRHLPIVDGHGKILGVFFGARRAAARDRHGVEPGGVQRAGERRAGVVVDGAQAAPAHPTVRGPRQ